MMKAGFYGRNRVQRWKCQQCGRRFSEPQEKPFGADVRLPREKIEMIRQAPPAYFAMWRN